MGRNGHGPKWLWAEMVMGRNDYGPKLPGFTLGMNCCLLEYMGGKSRLPVLGDFPIVAGVLLGPDSREK